MVTKSNLKQAELDFKDKLMPYSEKLEKAKQDFLDSEALLKAPLIRLQEIYFSENLLDRNKIPVMPGDTISNGKSTYVCIERFLKGYSPYIKCRKLTKTNTLTRITELSQQELINYAIHESRRKKEEPIRTSEKIRVPKKDCSGYPIKY